MANDKFSIKESLQYGWETFKANVPFFLGFMVVMVALTIIPDYISQKIFEPKSAGLLVAKILLRIIGLLLGMISTRLSLDIHDTGQPNLSALGELLPLSWPYVLGKIFYGVLVLIGLVLLIVPGIIAAYMFLYVGYLIIDRRLGPVAALQESRAVTEGYKGSLFLFSIVIALVNLLGAVCLFVGLFVTIPVTMMASVYVYRKLSPAEAAA